MLSFVQYKSFYQDAHRYFLHFDGSELSKKHNITRYFYISFLSTGQIAPPFHPVKATKKSPIQKDWRLFCASDPRRGQP